MSGDREERNRVLGFPVDRHPGKRPAREQRRGPQAAHAARARHRPPAEEPQRVLGFPADWLGQFADEVLRPLLRRLLRTRNHG